MITINQYDRPGINYSFYSGTPAALTDPDHVIFTLYDGVGTVIVTYTSGVDAELTNPSVGVYEVDYAFATKGFFKTEFIAYDSSDVSYDGSIEFYKAV